MSLCRSSAIRRIGASFDGASERERVAAAVKRLQIDARAGSELRRLSGGNQQKVVIARWVAAGFQTLLCFDPTRGIDVGTKHQIYRLLREMADAGSSVLLFTSELPEISLVCDRAIVLFGGEIVAEMPASEADEGALLRAAHGLERRSRHRARPPPRADVGSPRKRRRDAHARRQRRPTIVQRSSQGLGLIDKIRATLFANHRALIRHAGAVGRLPRGDRGDSSHVRFVRCAIPRDGGVAIGLRRRGAGRRRHLGRHRPVDRVGHGGRKRARGEHDERRQLWRISMCSRSAILVAGAAIGAVNGLLVIVSRVPDVIVTLTTGFIWGGVALLILEKPGGGAPPEFLNLGTGTSHHRVAVQLAGSAGCRPGAAIWIPVRMSKTGLRIYATGSDEIAAFRSGVNVKLARLLAYVLGGLFSAIGGIGLTMTTGIGSPRAGVLYTLSGLAAVVIGGVSLTGGRGGIVGPVIAAFVLTLIPADLIFLNIDPNFGQVIQGTLIVLVVMAGGLDRFAEERADERFVRRRQRSGASSAAAFLIWFQRNNIVALDPAAPAVYRAPSSS